VAVWVAGLVVAAEGWVGWEKAEVEMVEADWVVQVGSAALEAETRPLPSTVFQKSLKHLSPFRWCKFYILQCTIRKQYIVVHHMLLWRLKK